MISQMDLTAHMLSQQTFQTCILFKKMEFGGPSKAEEKKASVIAQSDSYWAKIRDGLWCMFCQKHKWVQEPIIEDLPWVREEVRGLFNQPIAPRIP